MKNHWRGGVLVTNICLYLGSLYREYSVTIVNTYFSVIGTPMISGTIFHRTTVTHVKDNLP